MVLITSRSQTCPERTQSFRALLHVLRIQRTPNPFNGSDDSDFPPVMFLTVLPA